MKLNLHIRDFIPPVIPKITRWLANSNSSPRLYPTYYDAMRICEKGYEDEELVDIVYGKSEKFSKELDRKPYAELHSTAIHSLLGVLIAAGNKSDLSVIDFGGSFGIHYFTIRKSIDEGLGLEWKIVESKGVVEKAKQIIHKELSFYDDLEEAINSCKGTISLIHCSGVIQCVPDPYLSLNQIFESKSKYVLFSRMGMTKGDHDVITIQQSSLSSNGIGLMPSGIRDRLIKYPNTAIQKIKFLELLNRNYKIKFSFEDSSGLLAVNQEPIEGFGLLCELKQ